MGWGPEVDLPEYEEVEFDPVGGTLPWDLEAGAQATDQLRAGIEGAQGQILGRAQETRGVSPGLARALAEQQSFQLGQQGRQAESLLQTQQEQALASQRMQGMFGLEGLQQAQEEDLARKRMNLEAAQMAADAAFEAGLLNLGITAGSFLYGGFSAGLASQAVTQGLNQQQYGPPPSGGLNQPQYGPPPSWGMQHFSPWTPPIPSPGRPSLGSYMSV